MKIGKLTALAVRRAKASGYFNDGGGLYLKVDGPNGRSWVFRYRVSTGKLREMGLGSCATVSLPEARERARACRLQRLDGVDPIEARRASRAATAVKAAKVMTFRQCGEAYIAAHEAGWRNARHAAQWPNTLGDYVYPVFGALPVQAVDVGLVMKALEPIWTEKPETASRVRGRIESVLDWATARGYRTGENPARWRGHLDNLLPKKSKVQRIEHLAALPYAELPAFMAELRTREGIAERALEFLILTAARTGEVIGAKWSEIDFAGRQWVIPPERMKSGREHRVPLSAPALAILEAMKTFRQSDYVFAGVRPRRPMAMGALLAVMRKLQQPGTVHGFRSAFSDWCAEKTNTASEVREMALAHAVGDKVEAAYRRGDLFHKRQALADAWAAYCAGKPSADVVPIRAAG
jgi:integrase